MNGILGRVPGSFSKMEDEDWKKSAVRHICTFFTLSEDNDELIILANEGLKDLASLGSERFAKECSILCKFSICMRHSQLNAILSQLDIFFSIMKLSLFQSWWIYILGSNCEVSLFQFER